MEIYKVLGLGITRSICTFKEKISREDLKIKVESFIVLSYVKLICLSLPSVCNSTTVRQTQ